jgi:L-alanine-DL-glutamate epimerase-like enolase superfamily enzyme
VESRFVVRSATARPVSLPLREPFAIATGAQERADNVTVRLELGSGERGLGEAAPFPTVSGETQSSTLGALERVLPLLVGRDVRAARPLHEELASELLSDRGAAPAALAGVEQALFDAQARALGVSLTDLFGGARDRVCTDLTITQGSPAAASAAGACTDHPSTPGAPAAARAAALRAAQGGFRTLKVKVGGVSVEHDLARLSAIRAVHGGHLLLDANGGYDEREARELLGALTRADVPIALFEEPVRTGDLDALGRLAELGVPLAADESARSARDVLELCRARVVGAVNVKIQKTGVFGAIAIAEIVRAAGLELMIGGMVESEVGMTFSAHLASGRGHVRYVDLDTPFWFTETLTREGWRTKGDELLLDHDAPGHGLQERHLA